MKGTTTFYKEFVRRKGLYIFIFFAILLVLLFFSINLGVAKIKLWDILAIIFGQTKRPATETMMAILVRIRLPRIVMAVIAGMGLAIAGAAMQAVLRNPLASSYTLGLSSAAGFGAALAIGLGMGVWGGRYGQYIVVGNAFFFSIISMFLVYGISRIKGCTPGTLILAGIAMNYLFGALIAIIKYIVQDEVLAGIVFWLMGGLNLARWEAVAIVLPIVFIPSAFLIIRYSWDLNVMSSGDEVATSLGVHPERTRVIVLVLSTLITAGVIAFTGIIGFVCLVGPHIARMLIGSDHRFLLPFSCLTGAVLLLGADTIARTIIQPIEIPVGIVTAFLGVPFFLHLLLKSRGYWK